MKVQSDCEPRPVTRLQQNFVSAMDHQPARAEDQYRHVTQTQMKQLNEVRMALKSEFDSMEESLRDALRQECRQNNPRVEISRSAPVSDSTITKRHNYITVYEHDQVRQPNNFRNTPNLIEHNRSQVHAPMATSGYAANVSSSESTLDSKKLGNISVEEFQRYCSLLTERIQKMEEQNVKLMQLAEHQKVEYKKVVTQVLESEKSQRLLLSECSSLRQQVQQLATHNRKLKEQKLFSNTSQPSSNAEAEKDIHSSSICNTDSQPKQTTNNTGENSKEVLKQLHGHSVPFPERYKSFDIASIVELYAALQKETLTDIQSPAVHGQCTSRGKQRAGSLSEHGTTQLMNVSHKKTESDKIVYEDPDYASPSSICAAPSCTRCITGGTDSKDPLCSSHHRQHNVHNVSDGLYQQTLPNSSNDTNTNKDVNCFDNNSYVEVELKQLKKSQETQNPFSSNTAQPPNYFVRQSKLRHSHNQYNNVSVKSTSSDRPSSQVLNDDYDFSEVFMSGNSDNQRKQKIPANLTLSPVTPYENTGVFVTQKNTETQNNEAEQNDVTRELLISQRIKSKQELPTTFPSRTASTTFSASSSRQSIKSSSSSKSRKYSRSSSTSELPPPPPPPPFEEKDQSKYCPPQESTSSSPICDHKRRISYNPSSDTSNFSRDIRRNLSSGNEELARKLDVRTGQNSNHYRPLTETKEGERGIGERRGSYSRACRKSQSCDHLYEQVIAQTQNDSKFSSNEMNNNEKNTNTSSIPPSPHLHTSNSDTYLTPLLRSKTRLGTRNAPSPTFAIQGSSYPTDSYEVVMPVRKNNRRQQTSKTAEDEASKNSEISPRSRYHDNGRQPFVHKHSSSACAGDLNLPPAETDDVFLMNKERLRNRRFSEGSNGNKQKDKIFPEENRSQPRRYRSVGCDASVNKRKDAAASRLQSPSSPQQIPNKPQGRGNKEPSLKPNVQQPRFPATNPYARADAPQRRKENDCTKHRRNSKDVVKPVDSNASSIQPAQQCKPTKSTPTASCEKLSEISVMTAMQSIAKGTADETNRGRVATKANQPNKQTNDSSNPESKKKGSSGGQSKSFVHLMKAKFSRSNSNRSSSSEKQTKAMSSFPITPASSLIDPRTLSLEPNAYLPPQKDTKKDSKQSLGQNSDAAVGRKLSQPFPNGVGESKRQQTQLNMLPEEPLPDEGFAEGSTIERPNKPEMHGGSGTSERKNQPKQKNNLHYINVELTNKTSQKMSPSREHNVENRQNISTNSYENFTPKRIGNLNETRIEIEDGSSSNPQSNLFLQRVNQKQTKNNAAGGVPQYENCKSHLQSRIITYDSNSNGPTQKQCYAADMIVAKSSTQSQEVHSVEQPIFNSLKSQKLSSKSAFIRPSKQKISMEKPELSKNDKKPKTLPVTKGGAIQTSSNTEKAFINSLVKAELEQQVDGRRTESSHLFVKNPEVGDLSCRLECSSLSSIGESVTTGSMGTISSIGSFPSDPFESNTSADDANCNTSHGSLKSPMKASNIEIHLQNVEENLVSNVTVAKKNDEVASPKSKLPSSKYKFSSSLPSPTSKESQRTTESMIARMKKNGKKLPNNHSTKMEAEERQRSSANVITVASKKSQIAFRPSKIASVSKPPPPSKAMDNRTTGKYAQEKFVPFESNQFFSKSQLSSSTQVTEKNRYVKRQILCTQPVYENLAIIKQHE